VKRSLTLAAGALLIAAGWAVAQQASTNYTAGDRRSGFTFLTKETQALQNDDFANPGMLWVEQGERLWRSAPPNGRSCRSCHGEAASLRGVAARYPAYGADAGRVVNLEQRINLCRGRQELPALPYESQELLALTAFVSRQSLGLPVSVAIDGPAAQSFANGRAAYDARRGQLDQSCAGCHEANVGARLRGEVISQGQINGFPVYRQLWQTMGSSHRMFAWCNDAVRAELYALGSQDYVDLELYVRWRGRGLPVEAPAVRR
jgi:sulfur-oxidizing protein SoxA